MLHLSDKIVMLIVIYHLTKIKDFRNAMRDVYFNITKQ